MSHLRRYALLLLAFTLTFVLVSAPGLAAAKAIGPDPTDASIAATTGPYATTSTTMSGLGKGFGSVVAYYPTSTTDGPYGVVAICPGFVSVWQQISWLGPRLASQGFVVLGLDTGFVTDQPPARADQLAAVITAAKSMPQLKPVADFSRTAVAGWSMGGGGALDAAKKANYKAVIALAPFEFGNYSTVTSPTMVITGQSDVVAPPAQMGKPFYQQVKGPKVYAEITGASHQFPTTPNVETGASMLVFLKRYVDGDMRYTKFLTPGPTVAGKFSSYQTSGIT